MKNKKLLTNKEIRYFKKHQNEITPELLEFLRSSGNEGKHLALEILDLPKNDNMNYLDAAGKEISFMSSKNLKSPDTVLQLAPVHIQEIEKCKEDFKYFRDNYITIKTKSGLDFPEVRNYQERFIDSMLSDKEEVVGLMGRQCIAGDTKISTNAGVKTIKELFEED